MPLSHKLSMRFSKRLNERINSLNTMSNTIYQFCHKQFGKVRTLEIDGRVWFGATDVAVALGYANPRKAVKDHCKPPGVTVRYVGVCTGTRRDGSVVTQQTGLKFIDEGNLYRIITGSRLKEAESFERWIFDELVPSTLREGGYLMTGEGEGDGDILARALLLAQKRLAERDCHIQKLEQEKGMAELQNRLQAPKVFYYDKVLTSVSCYTTTQIAKELGMSARTLHKKLKLQGIMFRQSGQWMLTAGFQDKQYTSTRTHAWEKKQTGETGTCMLTVWTEKGRLFLHQKFGTVSRDQRR